MASHITIETLLRFPQLWQKIHFELLSTTCTSNGNNKLQHCVKDASSFKKIVEIVECMLYQVKNGFHDYL